MNNKVTDSAASAPLEPLLTVEDLERLLRIGKRTIARLCKKGQFPLPLKLGSSNRWKAKDVANVLDLLASKQHRGGSQEEAIVTEV